jgi:sugar porter (SP) family MFS transporter
MGPNLRPESNESDEEASIRHRRDFIVNQFWINPFHNKSHAEMTTLATAFIRLSEIDDDWHPYLRRGAYLAHDPKAYGTSYDEKGRDGLFLRPTEIRALRLEASENAKDRWNQPFNLFALVACCSLGAAVQGWDETAVNQAQGFYTTDLGIPGTQSAPIWMLGLVNSAPYLCAATIGSWLTDPVNHLFGRRGTLFIACFVSCGTCVWQAFTYSWVQMFMARLCLGVGIGLKSTTAPMYAAECAPKRIRGGLVMMWQMWTAFGLMMGYVAGVVLDNVADPHLRWRLIIGSPMILPVIVCAYIFCLPESPRWLLLKARQNKTRSGRYYEKAVDSLQRLRRTKLQAARDMFLIYHQLKNEDSIKQNHNRFIELFTVPRNRRALIASTIVMYMQQFCGVNLVAYYSSLVFSNAGYGTQKVTPGGRQVPTRSALLASMGAGILNFAFAAPAVRTIDTIGRRGLLLLTFPFMGLFHFLTGLAFQIHPGTARKILVTAGVYLFIVAYSPGEGPVPYVYTAESMPLYNRALGISIATSVNWLFTFLLSITFPSFWTTFKPTGTFLYYAAWCLIGFFLVLFFVPETKGRTLEELDAIFDIPMSKHMRHGRQQIVYFARYHLFRQKFMPEPRLEVSFEKSAIRAKKPPRKVSFDRRVEKLSSERTL